MKSRGLKVNGSDKTDDVSQSLHLPYRRRRLPGVLTTDCGDESGTSLRCGRAQPAATKKSTPDDSEHPDYSVSATLTVREASNGEAKMAAVDLLTWASPRFREFPLSRVLGDDCAGSQPRQRRSTVRWPGTSSCHREFTANKRTGGRETTKAIPHAWRRKLTYLTTSSAETVTSAKTGKGYDEGGSTHSSREASTPSLWRKAASAAACSRTSSSNVRDGSEVFEA